MLDNNKNQIKLYLNHNLVDKYVVQGELFSRIQDYCRFMFAMGIIKLRDSIRF